MLELIAAAIRASPSFCQLSEDAGESQFAFYVMSRHLAALVVQTMRAPTVEMHRAGFLALDHPADCECCHNDVWFAMINAILNEKEPA